jgi:hypothetical protein
MSKIADQPSSNTLAEVVDLLVESQIRIEAMEQILVKTNPVVYDLYLGSIESLRARKASALKKLVAAGLKSKLSEG